VSHVRAEGLPGRTGALLIADAYELLSLDGEALQVLAAAVEQAPAGRVRDRLRLRLVEHWLRIGDQTAAQAELLELSRSASPEVAFESQRRRAVELLAADQIDDARAVCWRLLRDDALDAPQQQAVLRVLGRCYERTGDRLNAALCFAGSRPFSSHTAPDRPSP
jgi:hypothetical protein